MKTFSCLILPSLISLLAISTSLLAAWIGSSPAGFGEPTQILCPPSNVRVNVSNVQQLTGSLFRIEKTSSSLVGELSGAVKQCFEVTSGAYLIALDEGTQLAVPAFAELTNDVHVQVTTSPAQKSIAAEGGWCWVPSGLAVMGDTLGVGSEDERPVAISNVPGFWLGETEVTNAQYATFLSAQASVDQQWIDLGSRKCRIQKSRRSFQSDAPTLPVVMVSLTGAQAYCDWLSEESGETCRLPTEQEWEKAARGPETFVYAYGNIYQQDKANQESGRLKEVGSYRPNSFGLYDMTGNAFEWMSNQYDSAQPQRSMNQSLRGGSFVLDGMYLRNSFRMRQSSTVMTDDIGFRVLIERKDTQR